eukprot:6467885-Amphidinium_carterae.1
MALTTVLFCPRTHMRAAPVHQISRSSSGDSLCKAPASPTPSVRRNAVFTSWLTQWSKESNKPTAWTCIWKKKST